MVARARRVSGVWGAFPPYVGLVKKLNEAETFEQAFSLRANKENGTSTRRLEGDGP